MATVESKLDMSLDDLSKNAPKGRGSSGRGRGRGRGARRGGSRGGRRGGRQNGRRGNFRRNDREESYVNPLSRDYEATPQDAFAPVRRQRRGVPGPYDRPQFDDDAVWAHDKFDAAPVVRKKGRGNAIKVEGLSNEITPRDLQEIFEDVGSVEDISINAMGQANIVFSSAAEAKKAVEEFDQAEVDGVPMSVSVSESAPAARARRVVAPARRSNLYADQGYNDHYQPRARRGARPLGRGRPQGRNSNRGRSQPNSRRNNNNNNNNNNNSGNNRRQPKPKKEAAPTTDALDAELDDYFKTKA